MSDLFCARAFGESVGLPVWVTLTSSLAPSERNVFKSFLLTLVNVAEVGDVRHLLEEGQVEAAGLQQRPRLPDVDRLAPLPGRSVKDVDVSVAVHQQEAIWCGGNASGRGRVHDLHVP